MRKLNISAETENLDKVIDFINENLKEFGCPLKIQMQIDIAAEEIFVNIARYAYCPGTGLATVCFEYISSENAAAIIFIDSGTPFDPLSNPDPDVTLSAEERKVGGLGIYIVKKSMDDAYYVYRNGQNVLFIKKYLF